VDGLEDGLMLDWLPNLPRGRAPTLLFLGAHSDDIEIGCGGAVLQLLRAYPRARVHWIVLGARGERVREAKRGARAILGRDARAEVVVEAFRDGFFPPELGAVKEYFEQLKRRVSPDLIFTHCGADLHQDHRVVSELTWNTFRDHAILEYEIPKFDGGLGSPCVFVPLPSAILRRKVAVLMRTYASQRSKRWFTPATFEALARLRGVECNAPDGYAEAFYARKIVLGRPGGARA
jgi:LmbE family N-acetylglucosaminyl deacetylase